MRRLAILPLLVMLALPVAGCGDKKKYVTSADTEGPVLDVGSLKYQVQISRQLNPRSIEDRNYLVGVNGADSLPPGQLWFAVFMRVKNENSTPRPAASSFSIVDTRNDVYQPVPIAPGNVFAYHASNVLGNGQIPDISSTAGTSPIGGSLLLFRLPVATLDNRPLVLRIDQPGATPAHAEVDLDV
jgi:hypothetical protein